MPSRPVNEGILSTRRGIVHRGRCHTHNGSDDSGQNADFEYQSQSLDIARCLVHHDCSRDISPPELNTGFDQDQCTDRDHDEFGDCDTHQGQPTPLSFAARKMGAVAMAGEALRTRFIFIVVVLGHDGSEYECP